MWRLLQGLWNPGDTAAGSEDVAAQLIPLPHGAVPIGLANLGEKLEPHLILPRAIEFQSELRRRPLALLLVIFPVLSIAGKVQGGQGNTERSIRSGFYGSCCCGGTTSGSTRSSSSRISRFPGGFGWLSLAGLLLLGSELLGWMGLLGRWTHCHQTLLAEAPEVRIKEVEAVGQTGSRSWGLDGDVESGLAVCSVAISVSAPNNRHYTSSKAQFPPLIKSV